MTAHVGPVALPNPVMTASGTAGHGAELGAYFDLSLLGAVVVKSLSVAPWAGNPAPRLLPAGGGMLNSVGLQNPGVEEWMATDLPALAATGARVVVSVWGRSVADYAEVGERLAAALVHRRHPVVAVEANISCPNVEDRDRMFAHSAEATSEAVRAVVSAVAPAELPVWAKLSPNVTDLVAIAGAALGAGCRRSDPGEHLDGAGPGPGLGTTDARRRWGRPVGAGPPPRGSKGRVRVPAGVPGRSHRRRRRRELRI